MILWTIQPQEVIDIIERDGVFRCDVDKSENYNYYHNQYDWMVNEMDKRHIFHPDGLILPLWAWHTRYGVYKKPDLRNSGLGIKGQKCVCIEFEIPENELLLSDYDNWHYVLNNMWLDDSKNEEEWKEMRKYFDSLDNESRQELTVLSHQKIFNIERFETDWESNGFFIQATFWELRKDMIKEVRYFTAK